MKKKKYYYKHVYDSAYAKAYYRKNKDKVRGWTKKWTDKNKEHMRKYLKNWREKHRDLLKARRNTPEEKKKRAIRNHIYHLSSRKGNKEYLKKHRKWVAGYAKRNPIKFRLHKLVSNIRQRCINPRYNGYKYYGGRGIKCFLNTKDLLFLWERDSAKNMKSPSVDRIDPDGNYELSNCRFLELHLNRPRLRNRVK